MFARQKLWQPLLAASPATAAFLAEYRKQDPLSSATTTRMGVSLEDFYVVMEPDRRHADGASATLMAVACRVPATACDLLEETGDDGPRFQEKNSENFQKNTEKIQKNAENFLKNSEKNSEKIEKNTEKNQKNTAQKEANAPRRHLSIGFASALADTLNSYHVIGRLLPSTRAHVTVNMQSQVYDSEALVAGADVVVVSAVRKMGKQLCYCTTDILRQPAHPTAALCSREARIESVADLTQALRHYESLFHNAHTKAFMALNLDQGGRRPERKGDDRAQKIQ